MPSKSRSSQSTSEPCGPAMVKEASCHIDMRLKGRTWRKRQKRDVANQTTADSCDSVYIALLKWMKKNGFHTCPLKPARFPDTGRGLMCRRKLLPGNVIVSIPQYLLLTTQTVLDSYLGSLLKRGKDKLTPVQVLSIFLICEQHKGPESFWAPYIDVLPQSYTNAAYWSEDEVQLLPSHLQSLARDQIHGVQKSFKDSKGLISEIGKWWPELSNVITYERYRWAWSSVNTRCVYMKQAACEYLADGEEDHYALAPFLDLLNHSATVQVEAGYNKTQESYEICTLTPYNKYSQAFICYGPHDNGRLLVEYGFILPHNPHNVVPVTMEDISVISERNNVTHLKQKVDYIHEKNISKGLLISSEGFSYNLHSVLTILAIDTFSRSEWSLVVQGSAVKDGYKLRKNDLCLDLIQLLSAELIAPQSPSSTSVHGQMALQLRQEEMGILERAAEALQEDQPG